MGPSAQVGCGFGCVQVIQRNALAVLVACLAEDVGGVLAGDDRLRQPVRLARRASCERVPRVRVTHGHNGRHMPGPSSLSLPTSY
jgi:hypothetical protein